MATPLDTYLPILVAAFIGFLFSFGLVIYKKRDDIFDKTRHQSTLTTINVGNMQEQMKEIKNLNTELKDHFDRRLDRMEADSREEFRRAFEKIDKISIESYNLNWRVTEIENRFKGRGNGSGGSVM